MSDRRPSHRLRTDRKRQRPLNASAALKVIRMLSQDHGAKRVRIFGSFARGTMSSGSDIDLLVEMDDGRTLLDLIALSRALRARLGRRVDIVTERSLSPHLRKRILAEARAV